MNDTDLIYPADAVVAPLAVSKAKAAKMLGVSARTMFNWRATGIGPRPAKVGGRVLYSVDEMRRWLAAAAGDSTSTPGKGDVQ